MSYILEPVDSVEVLTLMDNSTDMTLESNEIAARTMFGAGPVPAAVIEGGMAPNAFISEHGFSSLVTVQKGDASTRILFDAGLSPNGLIENMRRLEINPTDIDIIVLSHNHWDHITGLSGFVAAIGKANLPVYIHPDFWIRRRISIPGNDPLVLPAPSRSALEGAGFVITEQRRPSYLFKGSVVITGEIERTTAYEKGFPLQESLKGGEWVSDPLVLDEQSLILNIAEKGLMVMSGCGHAGIVNTARYAQKLTGIAKIHAIIGGFHLGGKALEPMIAPTVADAVSLAPSVLVPAHCTGFSAQVALSRALLDAFIPNSVGTRFTM